MKKSKFLLFIILQSCSCLSISQTMPNIESTINQTFKTLPNQVSNDPEVTQSIKEYESSRFNSVDLNRDGRISWDEFKKFMDGSVSARDPSIREIEKKLNSSGPSFQEWFTFYDKPKKGYWTVENWSSYQKLENASLLWSIKTKNSLNKEQKIINNPEVKTPSTNKNTQRSLFSG